jgi:hypothetical protein
VDWPGCRAGRSPVSGYENQGNLMTIVIAYNCLKTVTVIADCRVSYEPPYEQVDDCLQKLYQIHDRLILGFAGPLQGAYEVMRLVRENARNYSRRPIADNLQRDVERWIRHRYKELDAQDRKNLAFMIATIEPQREKRSKWYRDGKEASKPQWFPYVPEWKIFALRPSGKRPSELIKEERHLIKVIGVTGENRTAVKDIVQKFYGFASNQPRLQVQALMHFLKLELTRRQVKAVGGLLQSALLSEQGIEWSGYVSENVILELVQGRFVQRNLVTKKTLPLMTIWEWAELKPSPGSLGAFENVD